MGESQLNVLTPEWLNIFIQGGVWIAMLATLYFMGRQLRAMQKASLGQNALQLVEFLQADEVREARTVVIRDLKGRHFSTWSLEERKAADKVCSSYGIAGVLIFDQKLVPEDLFVVNWGPSVIRCFQVTKDYIAELRKLENSGPRYWIGFDRLHSAAAMIHPALAVRFQHEGGTPSDAGQ